MYKKGNGKYEIGNNEKKTNLLILTLPAQQKLKNNKNNEIDINRHTILSLFFSFITQFLNLRLSIIIFVYNF